MKVSKLFIAIATSMCATGTPAATINDNQALTIDSLWEEPRIYIGDETNGTLNISSGGDVQAELLQIGINGSAGTVNITDGGRLDIIKSNYGDPLLVGGRSDSKNPDGYGVLNISGPGSIVTIDKKNRPLQVGKGNGSGVVNITQGGKLFHHGSDNTWSGIWIGSRTTPQSTTSGRIYVDGPGSELSTASRIIVGTYGSGMLITTNGGKTHADLNIQVGNQPETTGYDNLLQVAGAGSVISTNAALIVGLYGTGTAIASDNGLLSAREIILSKGGRKGELAVGARAGERAVAAGNINTKEIIFGSEDAVLTLNHASTLFSLSANLSGEGRVNFLNGLSALSGDNSNFHGHFSINSPASLLITDQKNIGGNRVSLNGGTLAIETSQRWRFMNKLTGDGVLSVNTHGNDFVFDSSRLTDKFRGTLALQDTAFSLAETNTAALKDLSVKIGSGSLVKVGKGQQTIGGLTFEGGTLLVGEINPGQKTSPDTVHTTGQLDISGQGTVQVTRGTAFSNDRSTPDTRIPLLEQDESNILVRLVSSDGGVIGHGGNLTLTDQSAHAISDTAETDITQRGSVVGNATYDYRLTSGDHDDGLYVNYALTRVDLRGKEADALILNANGKSGNAADLSAPLSGDGDLAIDSQKGQTVTLSNLNNDYRGVTYVRSGNLGMLNDNVLGKTRELKLADDTGFDMRGHSQTVAMLTAENGSLTHLNGGQLTLTNGGKASGVLVGDGLINVAGGTLTISGNNPELQATTAIARGAKVVLDHTLGAGTGNIVAAGTLSFRNAAGHLYNSLSDAGRVEFTDSDVVLAGSNRAFSGQFSVNTGSQMTALTADSLGEAEVHNSGSLVLSSDNSWRLDNAVYGSGRVTKRGTGTIALGDNAAWTGQTDIEEGGLLLGNNASPASLASTQVNIAKPGMLAGIGSIAGNINNAGMLQVGVHHGVNHRFTVGGDLINSGMLVTGLKGNQAGNQLVVHGNYTGSNGHLSLNTALGDDHSVTDKLVVKGDTRGKTTVSVANAGGTGAQTLNGIEVIHVDGHSDGEFIQAGRIVAGAYDYSLGRGQGENSGNWYLTSGEINSDPAPTPDRHDDLRPEAGGYIANLAAANTLFVTRLHDRQGETHYIDALTSKDAITSLWLRNAGGHTRQQDSSGLLGMQANRYVTQLGGDILAWSSDSADRFRLGLMAGYANQKTRTANQHNGYRADSRISGYSVGLYGTWLQTPEGAYVDTWAQYSWFDNTVSSRGVGVEAYESKGFTASLESGYTWKLAQLGERNTLFIQPQAQITWMGVRADDHQEANGTRVKGQGDGNVQTRVGVRLFGKGHSQLDEGKGRTFQPFIEANWLHNSKAFGVSMNGGNINLAGTRNVCELRAGVEGRLTKNVSLWGNLGQQVGDKGYSDTAAMLGVRVAF